MLDLNDLVNVPSKKKVKVEVRLYRYRSALGTRVYAACDLNDPEIPPPWGSDFIAQAFVEMEYEE